MQRVRSEEKLTVDPVFKPESILGAKSLCLNIQMGATGPLASIALI